MPKFEPGSQRNLAPVVLQFIAGNLWLDSENRSCQLPPTAAAMAPSLHTAVDVVEKFLKDERYRDEIERQLIETVGQWDPFTVLGFVNDNSLFHALLRFMYVCLNACPRLAIHWRKKNNNTSVWQQTLKSDDTNFR